MSHLAKHATEAELRTLLFADEESIASTRVAKHVENCALCQSTLHQLSVPANNEEDLCSTLRLALALQPESSNDDLLHSPVVPEIPLASPSHPEMLGRIGRYEIERKVGAGGMGVVFKAYDTELHRAVAIKVLAPHLARNGAARQRFDRESRAAAAVVHEHVVAIHNVESSGETPFLVMQYVSGESLQTRIERTGPLSAEQVLRIGIQAANGLAAAHAQGIVHRDVKPGNILLEEQVDRVLLTDFGLARAVDDASLTHTGVVAGTPHYMSPEQANGDQVDYRSDLFSLGAVLYFVATGHPPFRAERAMGVLHRICHSDHRPVWQVNAEIPDELSTTIDRLLAKKPSRRFASAEALQHALSQQLEKLQHRRTDWVADLLSRGKRHRRAIALMLGTTFLLVMAPMVQYWGSRGSNGNASQTQLLTPSTENAEMMSQTPEIDSADFQREVELMTHAFDALEQFPQHTVTPAFPTRWQSELSELQQQIEHLEQQIDQYP
jgi:serine/threonine protein kinase